MKNMNTVNIMQKNLIPSKTVASINLLESKNSVPVPVPWSPGMVIQANPSLFITPQKESVSNKALSATENILEPQSLTKVPKPAAWSPGMVVQPDPNLFITPDKSINLIKISSAGTVGHEKENISVRESTATSSLPSKTKEVHTVRFDLPSSTSGDETLDESDSPITLRGCELSTSTADGGSPVWKPFVASRRMYDPGVYSDDSSLDVSSHSSLSKGDSSFHHSNAELDPGKRHSPLHAKGETISDEMNVEKLYPTKKNVTHSDDDAIKLNNLCLQTKPHKIKKSKTTSPNKKTIPSKEKISQEPIAKRETLQTPSSQSQSYNSAYPHPTVIAEVPNKVSSKEYSYPFSEYNSTTAGSEFEHMLARPEFNSTLRFQAEIEAIQNQEVDIVQAVQDILTKSETKRSEISEKAAACTNRSSQQFKNLIDLNTSVESLCDRVVRMRTSKVPGKKKEPRSVKKSNESPRPPDIMEFYSPDFQRESPDLSLPGVTLVTSRLMTAPPDAAFDIYRHDRLWQGIRDF